MLMEIMCSDSLVPVGATMDNLEVAEITETTRPTPPFSNMFMCLPTRVIE